MRILGNGHEDGLVLGFSNRGFMSEKIGETATIRKYLLGDLPEEEAERIERSYFADGQVVDEVWAVFGEMAEERLSGALSEDEARRVDRALRSSPALRDLFENEKALRDYAAKFAAAASRQVESGASVVGGWRERLLSAAFFKSTRLIAASLIALITIGAFGYFSGAFRAIFKAPFKVRIESEATENRNSEGPREAKNQDQKNSVAQPAIDTPQSPRPGRDANDKTAGGEKGDIARSNQSKSTPSVSPKTTTTFLLLVAGTRGAESDPTLNIPIKTETVQLELESPTDDCAVFSAVLQTGSGAELHRWERLRARSGVYSSLKVARLRVNADSLKDAGYVIRLECVSRFKDPTAAAQYRFNVKKNIS
jgi:hypothetical protein